MTTIWKYPIPVQDEVLLTMPRGARLLSVVVQHGAICAYALVNTTAEEGARRITVHGTGNPDAPADERAFVGTVQLDGFVWHVFDGGWI